MPRRDPWVYIGLFAFFALLFVALFGERIAPHEAIFFVVEHGRDPRPYDPGLVFPFGSDLLGRDLFSLVLAGAPATLAIVLLGGVARVAAGVALAAIGSGWRSGRIATDSLAELVSAVPATLVALLLVKVFVKADTNIFVFIGALLVTGWAGPYRVVRAELDRLAHLPFTQGAVALGVGRSRIFTRHHLPHLVPVVAVNVSQQVVASLVLLAELGVLGVFVGSTRIINIQESLSIVRTGPLGAAQISDPPEWGGLLANARTIESLWTTRWLFLVPGIALALAAIAVAAIGFAVARRYARRNISQDMRGRGAGMLGAAMLALLVVSALLPERYVAARDWASAARAELEPTSDVDAAFAAAGLRPVGATFAVERDVTQVVKSGPATVVVGSVTASESSDAPTGFRPFVSSLTGGGHIDAPLVFASRGVSSTDYPAIRTLFGPPDLGTMMSGFADDYANIDVRGKVVVLVRLMGVVAGSRSVQGPSVDTSIANAVKRGAAAVLFVDPDLARYVNTPISASIPVNPYRRLEADLPAVDTSGVPVVVLSPAAADRLLAPTGLSVSSLAKLLNAGDDNTRSVSRELGIRARVEVPLERARAHVRSVVGEVGVPAEVARVLVWAVRHPAAPHPAADVDAALARELVAREAPFIFVDFDPTVDPNGNARAIADVLKDRRIALIVVLDGLDGSSLRFTTPYGDLIPAIDLYAEKAGAPHIVTRSTQSVDNWSWPGIGPFIARKTILVNGTGGTGDLRADTAALVAYLAGRLALGAEELPR